MVAQGGLAGQAGTQILFKDDHGGFNKQYKQVFLAFRAGDEKQLKSTFEQFVIPPHWFADTFGPGEGSKLAERYSQEFPKFIYATTNLFGSVEAAQVKTLATHTWKYDPKAAAGLKPAPPTLAPLPPIQYFEAEYGGIAVKHADGSINWGAEIPWKGTFLYIDGAFRFFGLEFYPFWDLADDKPGGFCADPHLQGGQVVTRVPAIYPAEAKRKHVAGSVRMGVTVATDGSVKSVYVFDGDPILAEAAKAAVMKWHYCPPLRKCSQAVEGTMMEMVWLPAH
jgi:TonB family protein